MGFVLGNWKAFLAGVLILAVLGYVGNLSLTIARQGRQIGDLRQEIGRMVPVVSRADLDALAKSVDGTVSREIGAVRDTLRLLESRQPGSRTGTRRVERIIERRGPPGAPGATGAPGAPGKPGTPLIPLLEQPTAREAAIEKVYLTFDDGHLVDCATPSLGNPNVVELLRAPTGALSSTSPCLGRIADTFTLREAPAVAPQRLFEVRPYLAVGWLSGGLEGGIGADLLHGGPVSAGIALWGVRWVPPASAMACLCHASLGASYSVLGSIRLLAGYAFALRPDLSSGPFLGISSRF